MRIACRLFCTLILVLLVFTIGCENKTQIEERSLFKKAYEQKKDHSDKKALKLAVEMIDSCGGYEAWKDARYLTWIFFDMRSWIWDKKTGDVRMRSRKDGLTILMNLHAKEGKVFKQGGERITNPDSVEKYLELGYKMWINDSYWAFMPFKVLDPGVRLQYKGEKVTANGEKAHVIRLSFDSVGVTPENVYDIYVDKESMLVKQWDYYPEKGGKKLTTLWGHYEEFNGLKLALSRGDNYRISRVSVKDTINRAVFDTYNPYDTAKSDDPI